MLIFDLGYFCKQHIPSSRLPVPCETSMVLEVFGSQKGFCGLKALKAGVKRVKATMSVVRVNQRPLWYPLTPRRERGRLILEAVPCLHHVQAEKNDIGGLALEAVLSFPYFQARRNDGRLRLYMPRSSPDNNNDNEEKEASDGEKVVASDEEKVGLNGSAVAIHEFRHILAATDKDVCFVEFF
ncbi:hypothetical protein DKX38_006213 [Salix brachista]|uniref:Uncharacterized protein n=1 Tax=Salix brachista TaxID=2182728 RepID=A0A5N5N4S6_9ROSI|nr:hypothetical protein DKX38_006213 [Salix brachista]